MIIADQGAPTPSGRVVGISDLDPAGGLEFGVLGDGSSLVAKGLPIRAWNPLATLVNATPLHASDLPEADFGLVAP